MSAQESLTAELRGELKRLETDLRGRVAAQPAVDAAWRAEYAEALRVGRTAGSWQEWSGDRVTQAAVAWVLVTVFVRFVEDNALVKPVWISGPKQRRAEALDAQAAFLRQEARNNPDVTDREWLREAVSYLAGLKATSALVDETSALRLVTPSGDAATRLLDFWRERNEAGELVRDLADDTLDTRFLGDLYQNLSDEARLRYALLQTPVFVEEFILDRTLEPSLAERPLEGFRMIDPACGSGHFLLGAFARLLDRWHREAPGLDSRARVQMALDAIHGVDLNPFAVAIARFRLTIAALRASGDLALEDAPAFNYHLAVGDSLLHGLDQQELDLGTEYSVDRTAATFTYATENYALLKTILINGRYDAVVGNPPYITVKDKALNTEYRKRFHYCKGTYAMTVPFAERFFDLAKSGERAGWVGQITSNSFMKREFGAPLIEEFLPTKDLRLVVDTSGAYIPGHGTPTVIVVGRNGRPVSNTIHTVLGVRAEPGRPADAAKGLVWTTIIEHIDDGQYSNDWATVTDLDRSTLATHPWSLAGGGAIDLIQAIEAGHDRLARRVQRIGFMAMSHADQAFTYPPGLVRRRKLTPSDFPALVSGESVRDFVLDKTDVTWFPYDGSLPRPLDEPNAEALLWPLRTELGSRATFGGTYFSDHRPWYEWHQVPRDAGASSTSIAFAFVATHNHFVLDLGGKVFNQSAPVIKLPAAATEDDHFALLGVLNSSTVCFWLRQNCYNNGRPGAEQAGADEPWEHRFQFSGTNVSNIPLPRGFTASSGRALDGLARRLELARPTTVVGTVTPTRERLAAARDEFVDVRLQMISLQEELDWDVYRTYGILDESLCYGADDLPGIGPAERAFAIVLARHLSSGQQRTTWFEHHNHRFQPITVLPTRWPLLYREMVERRIALIESHPFIRLLERPEYKRRWAAEPWERREEWALRGWLLDRLEDERFWFDGAGRPTTRSVAQLADDVAHDADLLSVLSLWEGRPDIPVVTSLERLLADEGVPFHSGYRYKESGLRKREAWEQTWALQRREDADEKVGNIPVPPKYTSADFTRTSYWSHRGKLDVPKERFILYPDSSRENDPTLVLGWAGWDHAQQSLALAQLIQARERDGWADERLIPLVAGLAELYPWVKQWHHEPDQSYGGVSPAAFFREQLDKRASQVGQTTAQLVAWRPASSVRGRRRT